MAGQVNASDRYEAAPDEETRKEDAVTDVEEHAAAASAATAKVL